MTSRVTLFLASAILDIGRSAARSSLMVGQRGTQMSMISCLSPVPSATPDSPYPCRLHPPKTWRALGAFEAGQPTSRQSFGCHVATVLSVTCTLEPDTEVIYKVRG